MYSSVPMASMRELEKLLNASTGVFNTLNYVNMLNIFMISKFIIIPTTKFPHTVS